MHGLNLGFQSGTARAPVHRVRPAPAQNPLQTRHRPFRVLAGETRTDGFFRPAIRNFGGFKPQVQKVHPRARAWQIIQAGSPPFNSLFFRVWQWSVSGLSRNRIATRSCDSAHRTPVMETGATGFVRRLTHQPTRLLSAPFYPRKLPLQQNSGHSSRR